MSDTEQTSNLPAQIAAAVAGIPAALVPVCVKALDRLIGATVDIPVAWLEYQKAKIVSQTEAFRTIDSAITVKAAVKAGANEQFADRALDSLVRKCYRRLDNKEAVSAAMLEDLRDNPTEQETHKASTSDAEPAAIDDDWLNVFERYAEDASSERMQRLWGRVLAGEVRAPGKYAMRTLRFLSEFSQVDALPFSQFCLNSFGDMAPKALANPTTNTDIRDLLYMESAGLIQGSSGMGLHSTITFDRTGSAYLKERNLLLVLNGIPGVSFKYEVLALTPLGQELVTLLPGRDAKAAARSVALAMKRPEIVSAYLAVQQAGGGATLLEVIWHPDAPTATVSTA